MKLTSVQRLMLYALGRFYESINQPLVEKPVQLRTSKITFIQLLLQQNLAGKQERAVYQNLEMLEKRKLIDYENRMIRFTDLGLQELKKVDKEVKQLKEVDARFMQHLLPKKGMQTVMKG